METPKYIVLTNTVQREGRVWVALCRELGTAAQARTVHQALDRLKENVELHLNTLERVGERDRFFKEHGIEIHEVRPKAPRVIAQPDTLFSVSINRLADEAPDRDEMEQRVPA